LATLTALIALAALVTLGALYGSVAKVAYVAGVGNVDALGVRVTNFAYDVFAEVFFVAFESEELFAGSSFGEVNYFENFFEAGAGSLLLLNVHGVNGGANGVFVGRKARGDLAGNGKLYAGRSHGNPFGRALFAGDLKVLGGNLVLEAGRIGASFFDFAERKVRGGEGRGSNASHEGYEYVFHFGFSPQERLVNDHVFRGRAT
jgi:hypothetical protein